MKKIEDKAFELLKELLLLQSAGGGDMFNSSINQAIDIYCEIANKDRDKFKAEIIAIKNFVWQYRKADNFRLLQQNYETLINNLNYKKS